MEPFINADSGNSLTRRSLRLQLPASFVTSSLYAGQEKRFAVHFSTGQLDMGEPVSEDLSPYHAELALASVSEPRSLDSVRSLASFCTDGDLDYVQHLLEREWFL